MIFVGYFIVVIVAIAVLNRTRNIEQSGGVKGFVRYVLLVLAWLTGVAVFIAVMYPVIHIKVIPALLGSFGMIWFGRSVQAGRDGVLSGWQTFKKAMYKFGFIGAFLSVGAILYFYIMRYFVIPYV